MTTSTTTLQQQELPNDVSSKDQLACLPEQYLSDDPRRPLQRTEDDGAIHKYALNPLWYSAILVLIVVMMNGFSALGFAVSQTTFLTGEYDPSYAANLTEVQASSIVSASMGISFTSPFFGGLLADCLLGDYWAIVSVISLLYIPGLALVALTAFPFLLGQTFNTDAFIAGFVVMMSLGAGMIRPLLNVYGAKQYHPVLQSKKVESYYVYYYIFLHLGSFFGGTLINAVAEMNVALAYVIPAGAMSFALLAFLLGTRRYVRPKPQKEVPVNAIKIVASRVACKPFEKSKASNGGKFTDHSVEAVKRLLKVIPMSLLASPIIIVTSQMQTTFVAQGTVMEPVGIINAPIMVNVSFLSIVLTGLLVDSLLFPWLAKRGIRIPTTTKFAIGIFFTSLGLLTTIIIDFAIRSAYASDGRTISVLWQIFSYALLGIGELLAISASFDATFTVAPKELKGMASAINFFLVAGFPQFLATGLYNAFGRWFPTDSSLGAYTESRVNDYLWVIFGISMLGVLVNLLPPVKRWVDKVQQNATDLTRSQSLQEISCKEREEESAPPEGDDNDDLEMSSSTTVPSTRSAEF